MVLSSKQWGILNTVLVKCCLGSAWRSAWRSSWPWRCTRPASSARCCTAVNLGRCTLDRKKPPGKLPPLLLVPHPLHHLEGQSQQHCCAGTGRLPQHAPHAVSAPSTLAGPCTTHGRWSHSQGCPVRRACLGAPSSRSPCAALQGRQARPQSYRHRHWQLGIACRGSWPLASSCVSGVRRGEEKRNKQLEEIRARRKQRQTSNQATPYTCSNCGRDCHARIGLLSHSRRCSEQDWEPTKVLTIVSRDGRMPTTCKLLLISPGFIQTSKGLLDWLINGGANIWRGLCKWI